MYKKEKNRNRIYMTKVHLLGAVLVIGLLSGSGREYRGVDSPHGREYRGTDSPQSMGESGMQSVEQDAIQGTVTMAGSTSMESMANALAEGFMSRYPQATVTAEFTGSSAGIEAVLAGRVDIGNSSRRLHPAEQAAGGVEQVVAIDGIVMVTDTGNRVKGLTKEQLCGIYQGTIRNWQDVGGLDEPVVVIGREAGSGTREAFEDFLGMEDRCVYANEVSSTGAVMARVSSTPGAIGYVSWEVLNDTVSVLSLDGIMPTEETIRDGGYGLSRPYVMVTRGSLEKQNEAVREFFRYLYSEEGKALLNRAGVIVSGG